MNELQTIQSKISDTSGEIVMYQPDETIRLEVRLGEDTVWLSQQQMAELFGKDRTVIGRHIRNIYKEEELEWDTTCAKFAHMGSDGDQEYEYTAYNLDVIISVGYRVKSKRGTMFRQWANKVLKDYLLKGYSVNQRFEQLEQRVSRTEEKIDFFVRTSLPPQQGIFFDGQVFDAYRFVSDLIRKAKHTITLIDNYVDDTVLSLLDKRSTTVTATIYTQHISQQLQLDIERHNSQYPAISVKQFNRAHDRFLLIDDEVYHIGASIKDLGKKWFAFTLMYDLSPAMLTEHLNEKAKNTPPHQGGSRLIRPLCSRAHSALRALLYLPFFLSMFLAVACEKELTHYPEIVAYHAESKNLDVATSDSVGKFNVKVKAFVASHPDATQDPLYPEIQKNIKANLLRLSLTIDDEWDGETFIEY